MPATSGPVAIPRSRPRSRRIAFALDGGQWQPILLALGVAVSALLGAVGSLAYSALTDGGRPSPSHLAVLPSATSGGKSPAIPSGPGSSSTLAVVPVDPSSTAVPDSTSPIHTASVTFSGLGLDAAGETSAARTFSFNSDGAGSISVKATVSGGASARLCLQANDATPSCETGSNPGLFTAAPAGAHARWLATVVAVDGSNVAADVAITWQSRAPAVTFSHGRFQGPPRPATERGPRVRFKASAAGQLSLMASWPPVTTDALLTLRDVTSSTGLAILDQAEYMALPGFPRPYSHPVEAAHIYELTLVNVDTDAGRPDLTATLAFP